MQIKDIRENTKVKEMGEYFASISIALFVFQLNFLLFALLFKKTSWILHLVSFLVLALYVLLFKDFASEKQKKIGFIIFKISMLIVVMALMSHLILSGLSKISNATLYKKMSGMIYMLNFAIMIASLAFYKNPEVITMFENVYKESLLNKILGEPDEEFKDGDAMIGTNLETKKPVRLPLKDRFLHCLILGPTGSGKTSQSIIPMINRDMQWNEAGIIVLEPKGDLAEKVYAMAKTYGREVMYFNPILPDCPYFNPLFGKESDVVENMATTFKMLNADSPQFFLDMNENLIRKAVKCVKRVKGNDATFIDINNLINGFKEGQEILNKLSRLGGDSSFVSENLEIYQWFKNDYLSSLGGAKGGSKTYEHCSGLRSQIAKLISNEYLRKVLNPPEGKNDIDFDSALAEGKVVTIATAQGTLRDLGRFLGYFVILQLQASVFRRPGNENTRRPTFLYIDEFQVYSNPGFADMLTMGRSYRVASHLATQNRALIGMGSGKDGKNFVELVSTNARNIIIYPGGNAQDADYYSKQFGEILEITKQKGQTYQKFNPLYGFDMKAPTESIKYQEAMKARFSPTDLMYREFGEITYCIIKNNSIQPPGVSKIEYIPKELNDNLDKMVEEYNQIQIEKSGGAVKDALEKNKKEEDFIPSPISQENVIIKVPEQVQEANSYRAPYENQSPVDDENDEFITESDDGAKLKNGPVVTKDDYRIIGNDIAIGEDEDDLI